MNERGGTTEFKDRSLVLTLIGLLFLIVGVAAAALGPVEMYCFYLFSEGGRFHYAGFGFGSFMFGNIAAQIVGYYLIAGVCIPLGYGHVRPSRWARTLTSTLLWFWLALGIPLSVVFMFVLLSSKEISPAGVLFAVVLLAVSYTVIPVVSIRFYRSRDVRLTFETRDPVPGWVDRLPIPVLALSALFMVYIVVLHILILFRGIFPFFGVLLFDLQGIALLDASILVLAGLTWGMLRLKPWAWWGSLIYVGTMTVSTVITLLMTDYLTVLSRMRFPPTEMEALGGLPFQGYHFALLVGIPLVITLGLIVHSKCYFDAT